MVRDTLDCRRDGDCWLANRSTGRTCCECRGSSAGRSSARPLPVFVFVFIYLFIIITST